MHKHPYSVLTTAYMQGQLILTPCPGTRWTSVAEALDTLKKAGACALLTLMPVDELSQNGVEDLPEHCRLLGIEWFYLPVEFDQAPGAPFHIAWEANRERIKHLLTDGKGIAIHCWGGSSRTGLIATQLLIEFGVPFGEAVSQVQSHRRRSLRHPAHVQYLSQFDVTDPQLPTESRPMRHAH